MIISLGTSPADAKTISDYLKKNYGIPATAPSPVSLPRRDRRPVRLHPRDHRGYLRATG
jgi:hypothetical protein